MSFWTVVYEISTAFGEDLCVYVRKISEDIIVYIRL